MSETFIDDRLLTGAAFVTYGLGDPMDTANLRDYMGIGFIDLVQELVSYVPYMLSCVDLEIASGGKYNGVFDYEVSGEFGGWFKAQVIENRAFPHASACMDWLQTRVYNFFKGTA